MKKLSEYKDEEAIEVIADLLDPAIEIMTDKALMEDFKANYKKGSERLRLISKCLKTHKKEVLAILAALERVPVEEYHCNIATLPAQILNILSDEELIKVFTSVVEKDSDSDSGSATENTEESGN